MTEPRLDYVTLSVRSGGDGLVHIERPRHHLTLCNESQLTRLWDYTTEPLTCFACIGLERIYWEL